MKYMTESGDTLDSIARKLGYPAGGADLLKEGGNRDVLVEQALRQGTLGPGVELDLPGDWDALPPNMVYDPDTHTPPSNGQPPTPLSADQRRARASLASTGELSAPATAPGSRPEPPQSPPAPSGSPTEAPASGEPPTLGGVPT